MFVLFYFLVSKLEDEKEYAVDKILDQRLVVDGPNPLSECYEYLAALMAWCSEEENTCGPYENMKKCQADIHELHQRLKKTQKKRYSKNQN